jgi:hypothetical protein
MNRCTKARAFASVLRRFHWGGWIAHALHDGKPPMLPRPVRRGEGHATTGGNVYMPVVLSI